MLVCMLAVSFARTVSLVREYMFMPRSMNITTATLRITAMRLFISFASACFSSFVFSGALITLCGPTGTSLFFGAGIAC